MRILNISTIFVSTEHECDMNTMLVTTDNLTIRRMAVINKRTNSEMMAGAKAMMITALKDKMRSGLEGTLKEHRFCDTLLVAQSIRQDLEP